MDRLARAWNPRSNRLLAPAGMAGLLMLLGSCGHQKYVMPVAVPALPMAAAAPVAEMRPAALHSAGAAIVPDPRYRSPLGLEELERVASAVGSASGTALGGRIVFGPDSGPLCGIRGDMQDAIIRVQPQAARRIPPNSWAFIFGHEFAHQTQHLAQHSATTPDMELRADIVGADYARRAGFDLAAHVGWILSCPNQVSASHGDWHARAQDTARHFGIRSGEISSQANRYLRTRW